MTTHTIQSGESFSSIAKKHGIPVSTLMAANKGHDPKKLKIGDKLAVPNETSTKPKSAPLDDSDVIIYTVKKGDTLSQIAKQHGVNTDLLIATNPNINPDRIKPNDKIIIPKVAKKNVENTTTQTTTSAQAPQKTVTEETTTQTQTSPQVVAASPTQNNERKTEVIRPAEGEYTIKKGDSYVSIAKRIYRELLKRDGFERLTTDEISKQIQAANPNIAPTDLGKPKKDKIVIPELVYTQKLIPTDMSDEKFKKGLDFVLSVEGEYSNDKDDKGGETNKGVTDETYKRYLKEKKADANDATMSTTKSVKEITDEEVAQIYYNYYYNKVDIEAIKDPKIAVLVFDTAVNCGPEEARNMLRASGGDVQKFLKLRREHYAEIIKENPSQKKYEKGWENRLVALEKYINDLT